MFWGNRQTVLWISKVFLSTTALLEHLPVELTVQFWILLSEYVEKQRGKCLCWTWWRYIKSIYLKSLPQMQGLHIEQWQIQTAVTIAKILRFSCYFTEKVALQNHRPVEIAGVSQSGTWEVGASALVLTHLILSFLDNIDLLLGADHQAPFTLVYASQRLSFWLYDSHISLKVQEMAYLQSFCKWVRTILSGTCRSEQYLRSKMSS